MIGKLATAVVAAGLLATAAPAQALTGSVVVRTDVAWYGVECLSYRFADRYGALHDAVECNPAHQASLTEVAFPGDLVGLDPVMGANLQVACQVYVNGQQKYADYAENGDGTDVNCLRRVN